MYVRVATSPTAPSWRPLRRSSSTAATGAAILALLSQSFGAAFAQAAPVYDPAALVTGETGLNARHQACVWVQPKAGGDYSNYDSDTNPTTGVTRACIPAVISLALDGLSLNAGGGGGGGGSGTEYTEDAAGAANPTAPSLNCLRNDTPSTGAVTADNDWITCRATNEGAIYANLRGGTLTTLSTVTNPVGVKGVDGSGIATNANPFPVSDAGGSLTVDAIDGGIVTLGAKADGACGSDTGTCSIAEVLKRANQRFTTLVSTTIANGATKGANSVQVGGNDGTNQFAIPLASGGTSVVVSGTVTASGGALETSLAKLTIAPGTAIGSNTGALGLASVTTSPPTYTNGQLSPPTLTTSGVIRVQLFSSAGGASSLSATNTDTLAPTASSAALDVNAWTRCFDGTDGDRQYAVLGLDGTGKGVCAVNIAPTSAAASAITPVVSNAASTLLGKNAPGNMYDSYLSATADSWFYAFNSTTAPTNGAVTAGTASGNYFECIKVPTGGTGSIGYPDIPERASVGIYFAISSTACGTLTLATTGFIHGRVQ